MTSWYGVLICLIVASLWIQNVVLLWFLSSVVPRMVNTRLRDFEEGMCALRTHCFAMRESLAAIHGDHALTRVSSTSSASTEDEKKKME